MTVDLGVRLSEFEIVDHEFEVPLVHGSPGSPTITVFGREISRREGRELPWLVFLQGGPGGKSPRPVRIDGWIGRAVQDYRVLLLDQRGTGRSTPVTRRTLPAAGGPVEQAEYLAHFRADSIVRDCELIRTALVGDDGRWSVLGQSFGGFCATTYLSFAPEHLDTVLITGGIPPVGVHVDDVYRCTYAKVRDRNERWRQLFPQDRLLLRRVVDRIRAEPVLLPSGDPLSVARLQYLGLGLGMSDGYAALHWLLDEAFVGDGNTLSDTFLEAVEHTTSLTAGPLFAVLHEPLYAEGYATGWSAARVREEFPGFATDAADIMLTGEMIYPELFDDYACLAPTRAAADLLAHRTDWPALYDVEQLRRNRVPVAAAVYYDDMYVARELSVDTARGIGNCELWIANTHEHDALRLDGAAVLDRLLRMARPR